MIEELTKFFNLIKKDKQTKLLTIFTLIMLFIFTLGYSLSMFNGSSVKEVASFPDTYNYIAEIKEYNVNTEVELKNAKVTCNFTTKEWTTNYMGYA